MLLTSEISTKFSETYKSPERIHICMTEYIMFGGKGGVGKTTCASATALSLAKSGMKTLVVSTDPAHSIADVYNKEISSRPTSVHNEYPLFAREVDPEERFSENYEESAQAVIDEASSLGIDVDISDFTGLEGGVMGTDEAAVIDLFDEYRDSDKWEYVVFDTAPTGHTLRMLQLPEVLDSLVGTALDVKSKYNSVKGKVTSVISRGEKDDDEKSIEDIDVEETRNKMERVSDILRDPSKTQFYAVMEPEKLSLLETKRLLSQLRSYDIAIGGVFANKVLTDINEDCEDCSTRYEEQQKVLDMAESDIRYDILELPRQNTPPRGEDLHEISDRIAVSN